MEKNDMPGNLDCEPHVPPKRQSRCGTKVGLGALEVTVSGTSVADDAPSGTEISLKDAEGFMNGGVAVAVKVAHATTAKYFLTATGYMTTHDENFPSDDVVDFSFQFDLTGAIDLTIIICKEETIRFTCQMVKRSK
jgi:hypothetical protein